MLGALFGFSSEKIGDWATYSPVLSYPGLLLVVLMAWSFQTELTMAVWLTSFYQSCVAVLGVPFIMRNFLAVTPPVPRPSASHRLAVVLSHPTAYTVRGSLAAARTAAEISVFYLWESTTASRCEAEGRGTGGVIGQENCA